MGIDTWQKWSRFHPETQVNVAWGGTHSRWELTNEKWLRCNHTKSWTVRTRSCRHPLSKPVRSAFDLPRFQTQEPLKSAWWREGCSFSIRFHLYMSCFRGLETTKLQSMGRLCHISWRWRWYDLTFLWVSPNRKSSKKILWQLAALIGRNPSFSTRNHSLNGRRMGPWEPLTTKEWHGQASGYRSFGRPGRGLGGVGEWMWPPNRWHLVRRPFRQRKQTSCGWKSWCFERMDGECWQTSKLEWFIPPILWGFKATNMETPNPQKSPRSTGQPINKAPKDNLHCWWTQPSSFVFISHIFVGSSNL